ncbi:60e2627e-3c7d-4f23-ac3d-0290e3fafc0f [Sclerotinia trifoliorum]|uniref:60e2627e-3c7d-4f23-ac3d-0290e3fafc0f n=1 Tax=Sclerotinia trifoliorum TaxID=28548 RepID=A0A8H2ZM81_9HELO|nr:60e2627e-3c7d-4f23-ac3d-0290e3fafc0f [Sclerotinia trifoliorum]
MAQPGTFSWINESPHIPSQITSTQKSPSSYRPRKSHTKSRKGCTNCRKRRIKCDEAKPSCGQCSDRLLGSLRCEFFVSQKPAAERSSHLLPHNPLVNVPSTSAKDQIMFYLENSDVSSWHVKNPYYKPADAIELLNHFLGVTIPWFGSPSFQRIMQHCGLGLSLKAPYLMHTILAFSASHLHYLHPEEKKYSTASMLHYNPSLALFSSELLTTLNASNADAIIASSYFHTMLAFRNIQLNPAIETDAGGTLTWLHTMRGVPILWDTNDMRSHIEGSVLLDVEHDCKVLDERICDHDKRYDGSTWARETSRALHGLFEVDCDPYRFSNTYQGPLRRVCHLMRLGTGQEAVCLFMSFVGELPASFVLLLEQKDPRALLILCYWSALFSQIDYWWVVDSAIIVCKRLCAYLERTTKFRLHDLLQFPASKCSYIMSKGHLNTHQATSTTP